MVDARRHGRDNPSAASHQSSICSADSPLPRWKLTLSLVVHVVALAQEAQEEPLHVHVGIRERHSVSLLRPLTPIQHASGGVQRIAAPRERAAVLLSALTVLAAGAAPRALADLLPIDGRIGSLECTPMLVVERNVANPDADRRLGDGQRGVDRRDRCAVPPHRSG
jgi:hypothetical protein